MSVAPPVHIAPYREIATAVAERLLRARAGDPLAPWDEEVIVPSRGMAEAIAGELMKRAPNGIASLQMRFLDELAQTIVNGSGNYPRVASAEERRLAMRMAVRTIDHPMMDSRGIASMLERSYRDVRDSGVTLSELAARATKQRMQLLIRAWTEYEKRIAQLNAIDPADLLASAARDVSRTRPQLVAGFYDMTGAQWTLVQALIDAGRVAEMWAATKMTFLESGAAVKAAALPPHSKTSYDTRQDELRGVCAQVAELLAQGKPDVAIVARSLDPYDARLINRFAEEFGFATTLGDEMPLSAHRIGRGVVTLLRLRERGFPRAEVLELVRDGLLTKTRIDVDRADAETRRARIAGGTSAELLAMRSRSPVVEDYIRLVAELEELTTVDFTRLGSLFRVETELDLSAAAMLDELSMIFKRAGVTDIPSFIDAIENATLSRQPPTANRQLVWAGDVMRFRGRSFSHVFAVRMQDDVFPQRRTEDPLLPDSDRRLLGIREIGDGREEEELLFQLLSDATSEEVHFSYANGDGFGKVLRGSRYIRGTAPASTPALGGGRPEAGAVPNRQLQLLVQSGTKSIFDGYIPAIREQVAAKLATVSPTQLEDFGECPQKFLFKHILGVVDIDDPEREVQVNHRDKGTIDHRILERFYRGLAPEEDWVGRLNAIIDEQFDDHEADFPPFNRTVRGIERRATKRILREFVTNDLADLAAQGLTPRHFEFGFGKPSARRPTPSAEAFEVTAGDVILRVEGTIDRIDSDGSRFRIVDYKSGTAIRHNDLPKKIDRGVRLQLALYAMAVAGIFDVDPEQVSGTIKPIVVTEKPKFAFALNEKRERLLETLGLFTRSILDCVFPAFPSRDNDFDSCKYCPVNHSCRTRHDTEERSAVQQHADPRTLLAGGG